MLETLLNTIRPSVFKRMRYLMGCFISIEVSGESKTQSIEAVEAAFFEMKRIERGLSRFLPESHVSHINRTAAKCPVSVNDEIFYLLETSLYYSKLTQGAFDITSGSLTNLWARAAQEGRLPSKQNLDGTLTSLGYSKLLLNREKKEISFKESGIQIDLGALGKGYAIDRAVSVLKSWGIRQAMVNAGSTIFCLDESKQTLGVADPQNPEKIIAFLELQNNAVSTSANYERYWEIEGRKYGHLVHPATGIPVESDISSASVTAPSALKADILSTAIFVLGRDQGLRLIQNTPDTQAYLY